MRKEIIGNHTLYLGDCLEVMAGIKDKTLDLVLTDPPYGIGADRSAFSSGGKSGWRKWESCSDWDAIRPEKKYFDELLRISKNQIIWGGNYFADMLPPSQKWLVWDKGQRDFSLADGELAWTSYDKALRIMTLSRAKALQEGKEHPTQKPVELFEWCLNQAFPDRQTDRQTESLHIIVFDGFLGSGTTCLACERLGMASIGVEQDDKYFNIACKRIEAEYRQQKLF